MKVLAALWPRVFSLRTHERTPDPALGRMCIRQDTVLDLCCLPATAGCRLLVPQFALFDPCTYIGGGVELTHCACTRLAMTNATTSLFSFFTWSVLSLTRFLQVGQRMHRRRQRRRQRTARTAAMPTTRSSSNSNSNRATPRTSEAAMLMAARTRPESGVPALLTVGVEEVLINQT